MIHFTNTCCYIGIFYGNCLDSDRVYNLIMVFRGYINSQTRAYARLLYGLKSKSVREIGTMCGISASSVLRINNAPLTRTIVKHRQHCGRPRVINDRQERVIVRTFLKLRSTEGNFSCKRLLQASGLHEDTVSVRTLNRFLNAKGYSYLQSRKKGLMSADDLKKRRTFARTMEKEYSPEVWKRDIAFYLDATSFVYKRNPLDQARAPSGRVWRKRSEGLIQGCTSKGRKVGTGGTTVKRIVAIS